MCIALISTAHPSYSLIIINNRDVHNPKPNPNPKLKPKPKKQVMQNKNLTIQSTRNTYAAQLPQQITGHPQTRASSAAATLPVKPKEPGWE
jgi:hypothetical protein